MIVKNVVQVTGMLSYHRGKNIPLAFPECGIARAKQIVRQWHSLLEVQMDSAAIALSISAPKLSFIYNIKATRNQSRYLLYTNSYMVPTDLDAEAVVVRDYDPYDQGRPGGKGGRASEIERAAPPAKKGLRRLSRGD